MQTRSIVFVAAIPLLAVASSAQGGFPDYPSRIHALTNSARELATGDFDEDGRADFALGRATGTIAIALTNAQGEPIESSSLAVPTFARDLRVADFDGDGHQDLAAAIAGVPGAVQVWLGDGLGGFTPLQSSASSSESTAIHPADIDGDGDLDLYGLAKRVQIWRNDGSGQLSFVGQGTAFGGSAFDLVVADWNADGFDDYALSVGNPLVRIEYANGSGGIASFQDFSLPPLIWFDRMTAADGNGDGHLDLVGANVSQATGAVSLHCMPGNGLGQLGALVSSASALPGFPLSFTASDLDADGTSELLVLDAALGWNVFEPIGGGKWVAGATFGEMSYAAAGVLADVNGDGALDAATLSEGEPALQVTLGLGAGSFDTTLAIGSDLEVRGVTTYDFDGDGRDEVVAANEQDSSLYVFHSNPNGGFAGPAVYPTQIGPRTPALGDVDGDGDIDALVPHELTTSVSYLPGDGHGGFGSPVFTAVGGASLAALLHDVDGDGDLDGVLALDGPPGVRVLNGDGTGNFVSGALFPTVFDPAELVGGDFDGDGDLDVVVASNKNALAAVHLGDGAGGFGPPLSLPVAGDTAALLLADLDGDGHDDLVVAYVSAFQTDVFFGTGTGTFQSPLTLTLGSPRGLGGDDIDADGDDDLFTIDVSNNAVGLTLGDPTRTFAERRRFGAGVPFGRHLAVGRFGPTAELGFVTANTSGSEPSLAVGVPTPWAGAPSLYCTAKTNSLGCVPYVGFAGAPSVSASSGFTITAHHVLNQKVGLFFYSLAGPNAVPFLGGTYCVKAPTKRTALQNSLGNPPPLDCSGAYSLDFNAYMALGTDPNLVPGTTVRGQFWSRDPGFLAPNGVGFTSAIRFTLGL
ncbi:MAG: VCBS repeat-containing protein [Planctomycetes bacterium]|nr:VCBS repeat-containing protein [Planctomycetota bacterium]